MILRKIKKYFLSILAIVCGLGFVGSLILYHYFPGTLHEIKTSYSYYRSNVQVKTLQSNSYHFEYFEGGKGPTVLFIHGFGAQKSSWIPYAKKLASKYKVIALDLPGHGNTPHIEGQTYDLESLSKTVNQFVQEKKLETFHLIGLSMGGGISSVYAAQYPQKVKSLTLLNPFGVRTPILSQLERLIAKGKNLFFPKTIHELDELFHFTTGKPLDWAHHFKEFLLKKMMEKYVFYMQVFRELVQSNPIESILPKIQAPTLLIIGGKDRIIHPSSSKIFQKHIPNIHSYIIPEASHIFLGSYFDEVMEHLILFLHDIDNQSEISVSEMSFASISFSKK